MGKNATVLLIESDIWEALDRKVKPEYIDADSWKVKFSLFLDESAFKAIDDDPLLLQQMTDVGSKQYDIILKQMEKALGDAEADARKDSSDGNRAKLINGLNKDFKALAKAASPVVEKQAGAVLERWKKVNSDKTLDHVRLVAAVTGSAIGLASGIAAISSVPFTGGVGGVVGIVGLMRSVSRLAGIAKDQFTDVEKLIKSLQKDLKDLAADFTENSKKAKGADLAKEAFNAVIFPANVAKSVNTVARQVGTVQSKLRTMEISLHDLAKKIKKAMMAAKTAEKELVRIEKEVAGNKDVAKPLAKAIKAVDDTQTSLMNTIVGVGEGQVLLDKLLGETEDLATLLAELRKMQGKPVRIIEALLRWGTIFAAMDLSGAFGKILTESADIMNSAEMLASLHDGALSEILVVKPA